MKRIGIGLIGSGFMGRAHAMAFRAVAGIFTDLPLAPSLEILADIDQPTAGRAARAMGFSRATGDWQALVRDPAVELVAITTPTPLHKPISLAAIAAGKHVYCEKPLAPTTADCNEMAEAAARAGVQTFVGYNYLKNPMLAFAREVIAGGEIGEVISFRGLHAEDYMSDPMQPWGWRLDPAGGHGAIADIGSHIISIARFLCGDIVELSGQTATAIRQRPVAPGATETRAVEVDDQARALVRFASGATGSVEASWVATGRKMTIAFEVTGTKGTIAFDQERMNEIQLYTVGQSKGREGFKTILSGPSHPHYAPFCPAPGHHLGFNDMKTIEVRAILAAIAGGEPFQPDFREAARIQATVDAIVTSARQRSWVTV